MINIPGYAALLAKSEKALRKYVLLCYDIYQIYKFSHTDITQNLIKSYWIHIK